MVKNSQLAGDLFLEWLRLGYAGGLRTLTELIVFVEVLRKLSGESSDSVNLTPGGVSDGLKVFSQEKDKEVLLFGASSYRLVRSALRGLLCPSMGVLTCDSAVVSNKFRHQYVNVQFHPELNVPLTDLVKVLAEEVQR